MPTHVPMHMYTVHVRSLEFGTHNCTSFMCNLRSIWTNIHVHEWIKNHNSISCKQPSGLDVSVLLSFIVVHYAHDCSCVGAGSSFKSSFLLPFFSPSSLSSFHLPFPISIPRGGHWPRSDTDMWALNKVAFQSTFNRKLHWRTRAVLASDSWGATNGYHLNSNKLSFISQGSHRDQAPWPLHYLGWTY